MNGWLGRNIMMRVPRRAAAYSTWLSTATLLFMLSGCVVGPKYHPPVTQAPTVYKESPIHFKESEGWQLARPADATLRGKWWEIFNDPELNALEEQLDINNQNIKQYFENYMEARALVREARSQYFPTVTVGTSITQSRVPANIQGTTTGNSGSTSATGLQSTLYSLPVE